MSDKDLIQNDQLKQIKKALKKLIAKGEVFAACPLCEIFLDTKEMKTCFCNSCNESFVEDDILYYPNTITSRDN